MKPVSSWVVAVLLAAAFVGSQPSLVLSQEGHEGGDVADDAGHHHVHVGATAEDEHAQLIDFRTDLAVYTLVVFVLLVLALWYFAFGPISKALQAREDRIRGDIEDAKREREKAEELRGSYEGMLEAAEDKVRAIYAEAHAKAEELRAQKLAEANREAEDRKERAVAEIERAKDQALNELFDAMASRVADATEHVLGRSLNDEDQSRLIDQALAEFAHRPQQV